jgi:hypothetical protein
VREIQFLGLGDTLLTTVLATHNLAVVLPVFTLVVGTHFLDARAGPVRNNTLTITLDCATRSITETHQLELHQQYIFLQNSSGVLWVSNEGLYYSDTNGVCTAFGDRKNTGALIVGVVVGLFLVILLVGIGLFVWYRNKQNQPEQAPLRV